MKSEIEQLQRFIKVIQTFTPEEDQDHYRVP